MSRARSLTSVSAALGLGALLVLAPATAAFAASENVSTPGWEWRSVEDNGFRIDDVNSAPRDVLGTGLDFDFGWTRDAFDGFFLRTEVRLGDVVQTPVFVIGDPAQWVDDGLTETVGRADLVFNEGQPDESQLLIIAVLEIEGSFARWTFTYQAFGDAALSDYEIQYTGNLGSDEDSKYIPVGLDGMVSYDLFGFDPILGYQLGGTASSFVVEEPFDDVVIETVPTENTVLTFALQDYDFCQQSIAIAAMQARVPTLADAFGDDLPMLLSDDCVTAEPYSPAAAGVTVNQSLLVTSSDFTNLGGGVLADREYFRFSPGVNEVRAVVVDGPSGLTVSMIPGVDDTEATIVLGGTLTEALTGPVTVLLYFSVIGRGSEISLPLQLVLQPSAELAATGPADTAALGAVALVLAGSGAALFLLRRRSVRA